MKTCRRRLLLRRDTCLGLTAFLTLFLGIFFFLSPASIGARGYTLGIAPAGTSWFEGISAAIQVMGQHMSHSIAATETGGTVDNALGMNRGQLDFGFIEMLVANEWYRGTDRFQGQENPEARLAFVVGSTAMHWAVRADSDVRDLRGLHGRPFNPSTVGGGGERITELVFGVLGIEPDFQRMHITEAVEAVKEGRLVGFSYNGTPPVPLFRDLHAVQPLRFLSLSDAEIQQVVAALPFLSRRVIPTGSYAGVPEVQTVGIVAAIAATSRVPADVVYEMTRAYWEHHEAVAAVFPAAGEVGPEDVIQAATIPLHAGAVRYYREIGLDIPQQLIPPEAR